MASNLRAGALLQAPILVFLAAGLLLAGCQTEPEDVAAPSTPTSRYDGPTYMRGSIASLVTVTGYEPMLVSGFGLVVDLAPGTGSSEIPPVLRQRMINMIRRGGLTNYPGLQGLTAERILRLDSNAIVEVYGIIPPGASQGTRFDLFVRYHPATQTTSLAGGTLLEADLSIDGTNPAMLFTGIQARGGGPIFANPMESEQLDPDLQGFEFQRSGVIVAGGIVREPRPIQLVLNQPSFVQAARIEDRINARFALDPSERGKTANARSDMIIELNIPRRYQQRPAEFIELVTHTWLDDSPANEEIRAERLVQELREDSSVNTDALYAWLSMGRGVLPLMRSLYQDENLSVRYTALETGATMRDLRAVRPLIDLTQSESPGVRARVAQILTLLPNSPEATSALRNLLSDEEIDVRVAAYDALVQNDHPSVVRTGVYGEDGLKYIIDRVPDSAEPLLYFTQDTVPRIVIFGADPVLPAPLLARFWDNRLMLRAEAISAPRMIEIFDQQVLVRGPKHAMPVEVFYRDRLTRRTSQYTVAPSLFNYAVFLGHLETFDRPQPGLNLNYSQVMDAVYLLNRDHLNLPLEMNLSQVREIFRMLNLDPEAPERPETNGTGTNQLVPETPDNPDTEPSVTPQPRERPETRQTP